MSQKTFHVPNISCGHCVNAIKNELGEMNGVRAVTGNPESKNIEVEWDAPATEEHIRRALQEINYPAE
jgi:copper ion binding protein